MALTLKQVMDAVAGQESGGDYNATNSFSGASGKYQFMPDTWRSVAPMAGLPPDAPMTPANQERVAQAYMGSLWNAALAKYGGDEQKALGDVASIWYSGQAVDAYTPEQLTRQQAGGHPSIMSYVNQVIQRAFGGSGNTPTAGGTDNSGVPEYGSMADQIDSILQELVANRPDPNDPVYSQTDEYGLPMGDYQADLSSWIETYTSTAKLAQSLRGQALGLLQLPDGTVIAQGDATPEQREQIDRANRNQYASILNQFGLDQWSLDRGYASDTNQSATTDFNNRITAFNAQENSDLTRFTAEMNRWLNAQQVADSDAARIQEAKDQALRYGTTNGKTDFTGTDLGAGDSMLMRQGGMSPDVPILRYPGTQTYDPVADRLASMAAMGVSNAPPLLPPRTAVVPTAPGMMSVPPPPQLLAPSVGVPQVTPQGNVATLPLPNDSLNTSLPPELWAP